MIVEYFPAPWKGGDWGKEALHGPQPGAIIGQECLTRSQRGLGDNSELLTWCGQRTVLFACQRDEQAQRIIIITTTIIIMITI